MERYDSYKDSGVEWIGEIPSHWVSSKLGFLGKLKSGNGFPVSLQGRDNEEYPFYKVSDTNNLGNEIYLSKSNNYVSEENHLSENWFLFPKNSVVFPKIGAVLWMNKRRILNQPSFIDNNMMGFIPSNKLISKYGYYFLTRVDFKDFCSDGTVPSIGASQISPIKFPLPPLHEQEQIVEYLDRKTTPIDSLIEKTVRKIELLKEKRTSLINEVVTKGLKPDVEMKDSGVEWIGEIPSHWDINQLNRVTSKITNGYVGPTRGIMKSSGIKYIQGIHVENGFIEFTPDGDYYVTEEWSNDHSKSILHEGDVVMIQTGSIGQVGYVTKELEGANCHALIILRFSHLFGVGKYLLYFLMSEYSRHTYRLIKTGEILEHLNSTKVKYMKISLPPIVEQRQIGEYLDEQTSVIDSKITTEEKRIELLKEYRQSLISEVVTGKVKVTSDE